jgi:RNA polymerase sigma factor (sigma-70 family)
LPHLQGVPAAKRLIRKGAAGGMGLALVRFVQADTVFTTGPGATAPVAPGAEDAALVARCRAGDGSAWDALVQRHQRLVYALAMRIGLDEHGAADILQTVFARLLQHLPRIAEPARLQGWIAITAKREALLQLHRSRRTVSMSIADDGDDDRASAWDIADDAAQPDAVLQDLQQLAELRRALDRLDQRSRSLLLLLFRADDDKLPYDEVARRMGIPVGSIGPTRARCLDKLRKLMP